MLSVIKDAQRWFSTVFHLQFRNLLKICRARGRRWTSWYVALVRCLPQTISYKIQLQKFPLGITL
jgi:hypothetical protein